MKLYYYKDPKKPLCYYETLEQVVIPEKYQEKKVRGFWVSTVENIDFPILTDEKEYKKLIDEMFLTAKAFNINTVFFQVRPLNDAFYKSKLNPWSRYLTGKEGLEPSFDVLEYIVKKGKENNIEIHAWCNPYRVSRPITTDKETYLNTLDDKNFAKKNPHLVISDEKNQLILNPTREEVKQFIIESMLEIVENYDVSGVHWDDYFYPYAPLKEDDNDLKEFENRNDKSMDLASFRRFHITDVIKRVHQAIKQNNSNLKFGVSPFGIWRSNKNDPRGSNTAKSTSESYTNQYADSYDWVKSEIIDYIVPQLYWEFGNSVAPFADLTKWWDSVVEGTNVELYIGHASYRLGREGEFENKNEVVNQLKYANNYKNVSGNIFFTYKNFVYREVQKEGMDALKELLTSGKI